MWILLTWLGWMEFLLCPLSLLWYLLIQCRPFSKSQLSFISSQIFFVFSFFRFHPEVLSFISLIRRHEKFKHFLPFLYFRLFCLIRMETMQDEMRKKKNTRKDVESRISKEAEEHQRIKKKFRSSRECQNKYKFQPFPNHFQLSTLNPFIVMCPPAPPSFICFVSHQWTKKLNIMQRHEVRISIYRPQASSIALGLCWLLREPRTYEFE